MITNLSEQLTDIRNRQQLTKLQRARIIKQLQSEIITEMAEFIDKPKCPDTEVDIKSAILKILESWGEPSNLLDFDVVKESNTIRVTPNDDLTKEVFNKYKL